MKVNVRDGGNVALGVALAIPFINYVLTNFIKLYGSSAYIVPSILWLIVAIILIRYLRIDKLLTNKTLSVIPAVIAVKIVSDVLLGLAFGFGKNPQQTNVIGTSLSMLYSIAIVVGTETFRVYIANKLSSKLRSNLWSLVITSLVITLLSIPYGGLSYGLSSSIPANYIMRKIVPKLLMNVFLTQVALWGGIKPLLTYSVSITLYTYLTPVLPALPWYVKPIATSVLPLMQLATMTLLLGSRGGRVSYSKRRIGEYVWSVVAIGLALSMLLMLNMGYRPMVVISGSMEPSINIGDLVVTAPLRHGYPKVGEVIAYSFYGKIVLHRVIGYGPGGTVITKGDANNVPDPRPVKLKYIMGVLKLRIPYVGVPMIYISKAIGGFLNLTIALLLLTYASYIPILMEYVGVGNGKHKS